MLDNKTINKKIHTDLNAEQKIGEKTATARRREALKKIGKYTAYVAPAGIAILSSKAKAQAFS